MSEPDPTPAPPHSAAIADALSSYYRLLTELGHIPEDAVDFPPAGGWDAEAHQAQFRRLGKSAEVVSLLTRLPFVTNKDVEIHYDTAATDWRGWFVGAALDHGMNLPQASLEPMAQTLPDHVVCLTQPSSNYGRWLLLDARTGDVTDYSVLGEPNPVVSEERRQAGDLWTAYETRPLTDLLTDWSEKIRSLEWVPVPKVDGKGGTIRLPISPEDPEQQVGDPSPSESNSTRARCGAY